MAALTDTILDTHLSNQQQPLDTIFLNPPQVIRHLGCPVLARSTVFVSNNRQDADDITRAVSFPNQTQHKISLSPLLANYPLVRLRVSFPQHTMDEARALLDQLMGKDRDKPPEERKERHFSDPDVCKHYLCGGECLVVAHTCACVPCVCCVLCASLALVR